MITIIAEFSCPPQERDRVLALLRELDVATVQEPGCIYYRHAVDVSTPQRIVLSEIWQDDESLVAHFRSPHFRAFRRLAIELGMRSHVRQMSAEEIPRADPRSVRALLARSEQQ
jgi:quinol monooxygenase YgiN